MFNPMVTAPSPFQRVCAFLGNKVNPPGTAQIHPRLLDPTETLALLGHPVSFIKTVRMFAFYKSRGSTRGAIAGAESDHGTEFILVVSHHKVISVKIIDPRTPEIVTLSTEAFLKRTGLYWNRNFPTGWATIESAGIAQARPDLQRIVYTACLDAVEFTHDHCSTSVQRIGKALTRHFGLDETIPKAKPTRTQFLDLCFCATDDKKGRGWIEAGNQGEWKIELFECIENRHMAKLLANNTGNQVHTAIARIEVDSCKKRRWVIAPAFAPVANAMIYQFAHGIASCLRGLTLEDLTRADPAVAQDLTARKRKREKLTNGPPPPCIQNVLYPKKGIGHAKHSARWRAASIVKETARNLNCGVESLVDFTELFSCWANFPPASMRELVDEVKNPNRMYTVPCNVMNASQEHICPFQGDTAQCAAQRGTELPLIKSPSSIWTAPSLSKKAR